MEDIDLHKQHKSDQGAERRISNIIIRHWSNARGNNMLPTEEALDPNILEPILDNCFLIKAKELRATGQHNYVYIGKNILDAYGSQYTTPKDYHDIDPLSHKDKIEEILRTMKPVTSEGEFVNKEGHVVKYRQCLVPLSKDGYTIESIFGGMRFKVFE